MRNTCACNCCTPLPRYAETRIRIYKTYTDAPSYYEKDDGFIFDRPLGIKRNVVVLPKGYELTGSASRPLFPPARMAASA